MSRNILISLVLLATLSCTTKKGDQNAESEFDTIDKRNKRTLEAHSFEKEAELYGEYYFPMKDISLDLTHPNNFELANNEFHGDMIISKPYAFGQFEFRNDTIVLTHSLTQKRFTLLRINEETLKALKCERIPFGINFLCWTKFYPNGQVKFTGGWENGKKDGGWRYIDEIGKVTEVFYENGIIIPNDKFAASTADTVELPTFPGGFEELKKYLRKNYKWKQSQTTIEGIVYVQFAVLEDGSISDPQVIRGLCEFCDREAIRLIGQMPKWKHNGKPKQQTMVLPIKFGLTNPYE
jgi:hypothetical protein